MKLVKEGPERFQNLDKIETAKQHKTHSLTKYLFFKKVGLEHVSRRYLVYSPEDKSLYCFCCTLFADASNKSSFCNKSGFNKWRKSEKISGHESSPEHRNAFLTWKEVERRTKEYPTLDDIMLSQMISETKRWKEILKRIIDVILLLCKQNLAFRGHQEHFGSLGRHESQEDENMGIFSRS